MSKIQTRRSVSLSKNVYQILHQLSDETHQPMSKLVEELILKKANELEDDARRVALQQRASERIAEAKEKAEEPKPEPKTEASSAEASAPPKTEAKKSEPSKWNSGTPFTFPKRPPGNIMGL